MDSIKSAILNAGSLHAAWQGKGGLKDIGLPTDILAAIQSVVEAESELASRRNKGRTRSNLEPKVGAEITRFLAAGPTTCGKLHAHLTKVFGMRAPSRATCHRYIVMARSAG